MTGACQKIYFGGTRVAEQVTHFLRFRGVTEATEAMRICVRQANLMLGDVFHQD